MVVPQEVPEDDEPEDEDGEEGEEEEDPVAAILAKIGQFKSANLTDSGPILAFHDSTSILSGPRSAKKEC